MIANHQNIVQQILLFTKIPISFLAIDGLGSSLGLTNSLNTAEIQPAQFLI